jgi:hypothetical protein
MNTTNYTEDLSGLDPVETMKANSRNLRGTIPGQHRRPGHRRHARG